MQLADPESEFSLRAVKDETGAEVPLAGVVTMTAEPLGNGAYKVRIGGLDPEKSEEYTLTLGVTGALRTSISVFIPHIILRATPYISARALR